LQLISATTADLFRPHHGSYNTFTTLQFGFVLHEMGDSKPRNGGKGNRKRGKGAGSFSKHREHSAPNPKRGGPGFLLTCETGRERKCKHEGLDIIMHYYNLTEGRETQPLVKTDNNIDKSITLEEEIALLKSGASAEQVLKHENGIKGNLPSVNDFKLYDTGCRGTVLYLMEPKTTMVDPEPEIKEAEETNPPAKKLKVSSEEEVEIQASSEAGNVQTKWSPPISSFNPAPMVNHVMNDIVQNQTNAPRSRFVTRMIPVQATCYAQESEIRALAGKLKERYVHVDASIKKQPTFAVQFKQRFNSKVTRQQCIDAVAEHFHPAFKVDLTNPDYTIMVEICKTVVCMSIFQGYNNLNNFNLSVLADKSEDHDQEQD